jgi:GH25 family lysozyme M1 (1,4-beta-N-acetylmuramidase)
VWPIALYADYTMSFPIVVDCSRWQPVDLDWPALKAAGVVGAIVQLTHGLRYEPHAYEHLRRAGDAGLLLGAYHWLTPYDDPTMQAARFFSYLPAEWRSQPFRVALDVEETGVHEADIREWMTAWSMYWPGYVNRPMIYTNNIWETLVPSRAVDFRSYELWCPGGPVYDKPVSQPPAGFTLSIPWPWDSAILQQFTGKGQLPGYDGDLDLSFSPYLPTEEMLRGWWVGDLTAIYGPYGVQIVPTGDVHMTVTKAMRDQWLIEFAAAKNGYDNASARLEQVRAQIAALVPDPDVPPMPQPLYQARALIDLALRDKDGNLTTDATLAPAGVVKAGTVVPVYDHLVGAGAFTNRDVVTTDGKNVWGVATALQRI